VKISLITTTINYPELLVEYAKDIKKFNKEKKNDLFCFLDTFLFFKNKQHRQIIF